jgi:hypothetical protein
MAFVRPLRIVALVIAMLPFSAAAREAELVVPTGQLKAPRRARSSAQAILDCNWHAAWRAPAGWQVAKVGGDVLAWKPDKTAILVNTSAPQKQLDQVRGIAARLVGAQIAFEPPSVTRHAKYKTTTTLRGTSTLSGAPVEVLIEQHWRGFRKDLVWLQIAVGKQHAESWRLMNAARSSLLMLVSHACECGYDCDTREKRRRREVE